MLRFLRRDPKATLQRSYEKLLREARDRQRGGDVVAAAELTWQADQVRQEIEALERGTPLPRS